MKISEQLEQIIEWTLSALAILVLGGFAVFLALSLTACDPYAVALTPPVTETHAETETASPAPTAYPSDEPATATPTEEASATAAPTVAATAIPPASPTKPPTATATPTATGEPTATPTNEPTPTRIPDGTPEPPLSSGLMFDGSFEGNVYRPVGNGASGIISVYWDAAWETGGRAYPDQSTDWAAPEIVPITRWQLGECVALPAEERCPLVWDGVTVLKVFSGWRSISVRLTQDITITDPGAYSLVGFVYPDQTERYSGSDKQRPADPLSSLVRLLPVGGDYFDANDVPIGQWTLLEQRFYVAAPGVLTVGVELVGPFGFTNNGWFLDGFSVAPASQIEYEVQPGDGWWRIVNGLCGDGNRWQDARTLTNYYGTLTPGQRLWVVCP